MGPGAILYADIILYMDENGIEGDDRLEFIKLIQALDTTYLKKIYEKQKKKMETATRKKHS